MIRYIWIYWLIAERFKKRGIPTVLRIRGIGRFTNPSVINAALVSHLFQLLPSRSFTANSPRYRLNHLLDSLDISHHFPNRRFPIEYLWRRKRNGITSQRVTHLAKIIAITGFCLPPPPLSLPPNDAENCPSCPDFCSNLTRGDSTEYTGRVLKKKKFRNTFSEGKALWIGKIAGHSSLTRNTVVVEQITRWCNNNLHWCGHWPNCNYWINW